MEIRMTTGENDKTDSIDPIVERGYKYPHTGGWKERRAYVILVLVCVIISTASFFISVQVANSNEKKFCDILTFGLAVPVPKPEDPKVHPSRERAYEAYIKVMHLTHALGCD